MTTIQRTRVRGRLTSLEYLLAASAKLAQADAVLKRATSVHGPAPCLDGLALEAVQSHVSLALQGIADIRRARSPLPPNPSGPRVPAMIRQGRVLFAIEEHAHE